MRKAAYVLAAVVATILLLLLVLPRVVSLDALRPRLVAALEEKTGRKATLSRLSLSLFPGAGVKAHDLSLSGDPGHESEKLLEVPEAEIRVQLLPLLSGRVRFTRIVLSKPSILLRSYPDGTTSLTDLSRRASQPDPEAPRAPSDPGPEVSIGSIDIRDARVALRLSDEGGREKVWDFGAVNARFGREGESGYRFDVATTIAGAVRGHVAAAGTLLRERGTSGPFLLSARGDLFRQDFTVEGRVVPDGKYPDLDLTLSLPKIRLDDLAEAFPDPPAALADARPEGYAAISAKLSGTPDALGFEVDADLAKAGWTVQPGMQKFIDMPCTLVLQGHRFPDQLILSNAELRFPPLLVIAHFSTTPSTGAYEWTASSRIASLSEFAKSRGDLLESWSPTGRLTASGRGSKAGKESPSVWTAGIDLGEVGFQKRDARLDFRSLEGHLGLSPGVVEFSPLAGLLNGQRFSLRGKLAQGDTPAGPLELKMSYFDLDALFPGGDHGKKGGTKEAASGGADKDGKKNGQKVAFLANLAIDAGKARGIEFRDLTGRVRFEKGVHSFENLRAKVFGGEASATGRLSTLGDSPDFRMTVALKNVEASELLGRKTSLKDFVSGPVSMNGEIGGRTRDFVEFSRTAKGEGALSLTGGKIRGIDLAGEAAKLAGLSFALPPAPVRETPFQSFRADFRIADGKIRTDSLRIDSDRFGLDGSAAVGFDKTIDLVGTLRLPPSLSGKVQGGAGKYLVGPGGRIEIPLVLSGRLSSPAMAINTKELAKGAASRAVRGLLEKVPGLDNGAAGQSPADEPGKAIRGVIERFLPGRK